MKAAAEAAQIDILVEQDLKDKIKYYSPAITESPKNKNV